MVRKELYKAAYQVFHPFVGLVSWKKRGVVSAFQHSLNTAAIAGGIAGILTDDQDIVDVATYCGLLHDVYQKAEATDKSLTKDKFKEVIFHTLENIGLEKNLKSKVLEGCQYNVAENPGIWLDKYSIAAKSVWLADFITSAESAFDIIVKMRDEMIKEKIKEIRDRLKLYVVSMFVPQVMLRSLIYQMIIEHVQKQLRETGLDKTHALFILTRNGLLMILRNELNITWPIEIDYMKLKKRIGATSDEISDVIRKGSKTEPKKWIDIGKFTVDSNKTIKLDSSIESSLFGVKLLSIDYENGENSCIICGSRVADPIRPTIYGRLKYNEASTERWSPRYPGCINMNVLLQNWERNKIFICPLCVLEALTQRKVVIGYEQKFRSVDYIIQLFFAKPTHYEVAHDLSALAHRIIVAIDGKEKPIETEELIQRPWSIVERVGTDEKSMILLDFTWALHLTPISGSKKELEDFAEILPDLSKAIISTGIYPAKFSHIPDPTVERRVIMPVHPLYNYDVNDDRYGRLIPLTLFMMTLLHKLDGSIIRKERIRSTLKYLDYPFWIVEDLLMKHSVGREVLHAYDMYIKDPYRFTFE
ncbi:MAG: hypothetical protein QXP86_03500 [Nitrososphaerota archaeon]